MVEMSKKLRDMIHEKYKLNINHITLERNKGREIWLADTGKGSMIIKKFSRTEPRVKFIVEGIRHLKNNGINTPKIHTNKDNKLYTNFRGNCYILMEVIIGRPPRYQNTDDLKAITNELGRFHRLSKGFIPPAESQIISYLGTWPNMLINGLNTLRYANKFERNKDKNSEFKEVILQELPHFKKRIKKLIPALEGSYYNSWVEKAKKNGSLCHLDYARYNIKIDPNNRVYIFDFDTLALDLPVLDIRKLIYHIYYTNLYDKDTIKNVLCWYQQYNPLTKEEWKVAKLIFMYPIELISALEKYLKTKKGKT